MTDDGVNVYPVGLLRDLRTVVRTIRYQPKRTRKAAKNLLAWFGRSWRRGSYWNGYLAEPTTVPSPDRPWWRCGHGWTKRRALRDLERHLAEASHVWDDRAALRDGSGQ